MVFRDKRPREKRSCQAERGERDDTSLVATPIDYVQISIIVRAVDCRENERTERELDVEIPMLESQGDPNDLRASLGERDQRGDSNRTEFNLSHNSSDTHTRTRKREEW